MISVLPQRYKSIYVYIFFIGLGIAFAIFTNPFLRYPYDVFAHLIAIDELYHGAIKSTTSIPQGRLLWHHAWADIFQFFHIDSRHLLLRAHIIHSVQTFLALSAIYYFSYVTLRNLFKKIDKLTLLWLSLWSTIIWITTFSTHSVHYSLIWNLWYSINYQITLPLFFYMVALTLVISLENNSKIKNIFFILQIILISLFILKVHAMEFMYYLMYLSVLSLFYIDKLYTFFKKYYLFIAIALIGVVYFVKHYLVESSKIFLYLHLDTLPSLYNKIILLGNYALIHLNRADSVVNEMMYLILYLTLPFLLLVLWEKYQNKTYINLRLLLVILGTSLFVLIPQYTFTAGLFALISRVDVVHRIYFSSSLFILLPLYIYHIAQIYSWRLRTINMVIFTILLSMAIFSKHTTFLSHNYYNNLHSISESFNHRKLNFHLSEENISLIGQKIELYEKENHSGKKIRFYARSDIAFVIKYIYHKEVYWEGRRRNPNYIRHYHNDKVSNTYHKVLFETPEVFPKYIPFW